MEGKLKFLAACLILALSAAQHWEFAGWYGGCYPDLEPDPSTPGRLYLSSDVAGIWRSDDRGDTCYRFESGER